MIVRCPGMAAMRRTSSLNTAHGQPRLMVAEIQFLLRRLLRHIAAPC